MACSPGDFRYLSGRTPADHFFIAKITPFIAEIPLKQEECFLFHIVAICIHIKIAHAIGLSERLSSTFS